MTDFTTADYFSDESVAADTYPYFDFLLEGRRVWREPYHGVVMVAGHEEVLTVLRDPARFSNCNIVAGPSFTVPGRVQRRRRHRASSSSTATRLPMGDQIITFDPPKHTAHRGLLMGLITPKRLKENEEFMWRLADRQLDVVLPGGQCEFIDDFAQPYTLLVIADLLGVPEADHPSLLRRAGVGRRLLGDTGEDEGRPDHPLDFLYGYFTERIEQLREEPRGDVLTGMARATFPDGSLPEPVDVARIAANLFSAGQETTVRLLSTALRLICDEPGPAAAAAGAPRAHPPVHRGDAADREPDQGRVPPGAEDHHPGRGGDSGGQHDHAAARGDRPGPAPVRVPARAQDRPAQRPPAHLVRGRHPHLPGSAAGAGRGTRRHRSPVRPDEGDPGLRRPRTARPATAATTTCRPT